MILELLLVAALGGQQITPRPPAGPTFSEGTRIEFPQLDTTTDPQTIYFWPPSNPEVAFDSYQVELYVEGLADQDIGAHQYWPPLTCQSLVNGTWQFYQTNVNGCRGNPLRVQNIGIPVSQVDGRLAWSGLQPFYAGVAAGNYILVVRPVKAVAPTAGPYSDSGPTLIFRKS